MKDLHQAAIAINKAETSMKMMLEIRNKASVPTKRLLGHKFNFLPTWNNLTLKKSKFFFYLLSSLLDLLSSLERFYWATIDRRLPKLEHSEVNYALRGNIISSDGFKIATSQKLYKAIVDTRNIDPQKFDLFVKLYSLYSGDDPKAVAATLEIILVQRFYRIKLIQRVQNTFKNFHENFTNWVFLKVLEDPKTGVAFLHGLSVIESGEYRLYPSGDSVTPIVGYVKKIEQKNITKSTGVKGIERFYEDKLSSVQDSLIVGARDISNAIILDGNSISSRRFDGMMSIWPFL